MILTNTPVKPHPDKEQIHTQDDAYLHYKEAYFLMCQTKALAELYEQKKDLIPYVSATSRGHEAIQIALGLNLLPQDFVSPYYRDEAMLLSIGLTPYQLLQQLFAKKDDPFSGGRNHGSHPSLRQADLPKIMMQSSSTGMQAIPCTGAALGLKYLRKQNLLNDMQDPAIGVCSLGDGSITEGEVSEAFQIAVLKRLPVLYLVQDNEWSLSAYSSEIRAQDATYFAKGFKGLETRTIDGTNFEQCYNTVKEVIKIIRNEERPFLIHAKVPLLNHHTSGVRRELYRDDWERIKEDDPIPKLHQFLIGHGINNDELLEMESRAETLINLAFEKVLLDEDPNPDTVMDNIFVPTTLVTETGVREPAGGKPTVMIDGAITAMQEILEKHPEALFFGQDVGPRLGGVFREAATLAARFGEHRVFNMPIQEAFTVGSTVGLSATGCKPIVEIPFADFIWPGLNQLFAEVSRSCYLSEGKWPVDCLIRIGVGAYGNGGPYHSSSIESVLCNIQGIKIVYPSNGADLKGLMKAAFYDRNPVIILEHKGLYWSKTKDSEGAKSILPDADYIVPLGSARIVLNAQPSATRSTLTIITYGMGVHWSVKAATGYVGRIEIIDLRSLVPLDETAIYSSVKKHGRCMIVTEEPSNNSFAQALAGKIQSHCFKYLDAPVLVIGALNIPAIPINTALENAALPNSSKVADGINYLLAY